MTRPVIDLATSADDAAIRDLLRREPMPGRISLTYEREPDFWQGCAVTGDDCRVMVARDGDNGEVVGLACRSTRTVFVNGTERRIGYLSQLRIDSRFRGRWLVSRGFSKLRQLHDVDPLPAYLTAIVDGNPEATGILVIKRRSGFPVFHPVADFRSLAIGIHRPKPPFRAGHAVSSACVSDLDEVARFLNVRGSQRQFFPKWTVEGLARLSSYGLGAADIKIVRSGSEIVGVASLWDQSAYKQTVIHGYSGWLKRLAPLYNGTTPLLGRPKLPRPGEKLQSAYASLICVAKDDLEVFQALLRELYNAALDRHLSYLLVGLDPKDPLLAATCDYSRVTYPSRLYLAEWPDGDGIHEQLDGRPTYVDIATL